jgi:hypothetical protein
VNLKFVSANSWQRELRFFGRLLSSLEDFANVAALWRQTSLSKPHPASFRQGKTLSFQDNRVMLKQPDRFIEAVKSV